MRMLQARGDGNLALESLGALVALELFREHLDHHASPERELLGEEHMRRASPLEFALDGESASQCRLHLRAIVHAGT